MQYEVKLIAVFELKGYIATVCSLILHAVAVGSCMHWQPARTTHAAAIAIMFRGFHTKASRGPGCCSSQTPSRLLRNSRRWLATDTCGKHGWKLKQTADTICCTCHEQPFLQARKRFLDLRLTGRWRRHKLPAPHIRPESDLSAASMAEPSTSFL